MKKATLKIIVLNARRYDDRTTRENNKTCVILLYCGVIYSLVAIGTNVCGLRNMIYLKIQILKKNISV